MCTLNIAISMIEESRKYSQLNYSGDAILIITAGHGVFKVQKNIYKVYQYN